MTLEEQIEEEQANKPDRFWPWWWTENPTEPRDPVPYNTPWWFVGGMALGLVLVLIMLA